MKSINRIIYILLITVSLSFGQSLVNDSLELIEEFDQKIKSVEYKIYNNSLGEEKELFEFTLNKNRKLDDKLIKYDNEGNEELIAEYKNGILKNVIFYANKSWHGKLRYDFVKETEDSKDESALRIMSENGRTFYSFILDSKNKEIKVIALFDETFMTKTSECYNYEWKVFSSNHSDYGKFDFKIVKNKIVSGTCENSGKNINKVKLKLINKTYKEKTVNIGKYKYKIKYFDYDLSKVCEEKYNKN